MTNSQKTLAIVLRVVEFSESSCVVTLFSREFGKVSGLAKGARRPKNPFESALDLLAVCRIVFIHKSSDALDILTEAKLQRHFRSSRINLSSLYTGYYVAELLNELTDLGDAYPQLFDAADGTLLALDAGQDPVRTILRFEMTALRVLGHLPSLDYCAGCGEPVTRSPRMAFGQLAGGVLCSKCRVGRRQVVSLSDDAVEALVVLAGPDEETWKSIRLEPKTRGQLRGVINHYMNNLIGRRPRLQTYLKVLDDKDGQNAACCNVDN